MNEATGITDNNLQNSPQFIIEENSQLLNLNEQYQIYGDLVNNGRFSNTQQTFNFAQTSMISENSLTFQDQQNLFENSEYSTLTHTEFLQNTSNCNIPLDLSKPNSSQMSNFSKAGGSNGLLINISNTFYTMSCNLINNQKNLLCIEILIFDFNFKDYVFILNFLFFQFTKNFP